MAEINDLTIVDASNTARFPENMAPSAVNNGARALEGIVARWHRDINGSVQTGGTSTAYTYAANQTISAYYDGLMLGVDFHTASGASPTLNVDSVGAASLVWPDGTAVGSGEIPANGKALVVYDGTNFQIISIAFAPGALASNDTVDGTEIVIGSDAQGDVLYYNGSAWVRLGAGTSGEFLQTQGAGANPQWATVASPGLVLLASASPSAAASVDVTSAITSTYKSYLLVFENFVPATDDVELWFRTSTDNSTFDSGASDYEYAYTGISRAGTTYDVNDASAAQILLSLTGAGLSIGSTAGEGVSGRVWLSDPLDTGRQTRVSYEIHGVNANGLGFHLNGYGMRKSVADVDAVQLLFESGNIASGEVRLYGLRES